MIASSARFTVTVAETRPADAIEVDVATPPVAFAGARRLVRALEHHAPACVAAIRARHVPEWNALFPRAGLAGLDLLEIADAPNQRRLFRESEQTYRVLNMVAHVIVGAVGELERPLLLRNAGACDLVSLRGVMHAVELGRLTEAAGTILLGEWHAACPVESFQATRLAQLQSIHHRMRTRGDVPVLASTARLPFDATTLEEQYLALVSDAGAPDADRIAAAMLAIRACFFSTNYEGSALAIELGLELLDRSTPAAAALQAAWDRLADRQFDIPMLELDRTHLADAGMVRAQLLLHRGVNAAFTVRSELGLESFAQALALPNLAPETIADLHMYRAAALTKRMGRTADARVEIEAGLAAIAGGPRETASLPAAPGPLRALGALHALERLYLDDTFLADSDVADFTKLTKLRVLHVDTTNLTDASYDVLRTFTRLEELTIGDTQVAPDVVTLEFPRLHVLSLVGLQLHDPDLGNLTHHTSLVGLDLSGTEITNPAALVAMPSLRVLGLAQTKLSRAGTEALQTLASHGIEIKR